MIDGRGGSRFGYPWNFVTVYYHQRDLTLEVCLGLEIFTLQKQAIFLNLTTT